MRQWIHDYTDDQLYRALASRDARFDGKFFVAVTSTGIYCRPVCRVRLPRPENCRFHGSAAQAEAAGFRPCLRCRPEQAPGWSDMDAATTLAHQALRLVEREGIDNIGQLSARMGISDRHLRRLFRRSFGVTPGQYLRTRRLLLAKTLLTDTSLPVRRVAEYSGFNSVSRFYHHFQTHYGLTPTSLRQGAGKTAGELKFSLAYRPPYDWEALLQYLAGRAIPGIECVQDGRYTRHVAVLDHHGQCHEGWLQVSHAALAHRLDIRCADSLAAVIPQCLERLRALFDLDADPERISRGLGDLGRQNPGLRIPGAWDGFELAARAVLGQQISVRAATTLAGRLAEQFEGRIASPWPGLDRRFPLAGEFLELDGQALTRQGLSRRSVQALRAIAEAARDGRLDLDPGADPEPARRELLAIHGIGEWTFNYIAMRALRWPDAFLAGDLGVRKALGMVKAEQAEKLAEAWRPWRAYAVLHLWSKPA